MIISKPLRSIVSLAVMASLFFAAPAANAVGSSNSFLHPRFTLATPKNIVATPSATSVAVTFDSVENATSYTVRVYNRRGRQVVGTYTNVHSGSSVTGLTSLTKYNVTVQAIGNGANIRNSKESEKVRATTTLAGCADGGACAVGDVGPAGGTVYYVSVAGFNCGQTFSSTGGRDGGLCHYLEVAPQSGMSGYTDLATKWSENTGLNVDVTGSAIGQGYANNMAMLAVDNTPGKAGTMARAFTTTVSGTTYSDWYLPSIGELNALFTQYGSAAFASPGNYWSSTENFDYGPGAYSINTTDGSNNFSYKWGNLHVVPIRAF